jgi:RNA-directed DNA polymerase
MNSSLFKKKQLNLLASEIGCSVEEIVAITADIDQHYRQWVEQKINKKTGKPKTYSDGTIKQRVISPPLLKLGIIQTKIKDRILAKIPLPENIHGGVRGKSNITNALPHKGKKYIFTTDLQDFFPNISSRQIVDSFLKLGYSDHYSHWMAKLVTWQYQVPQGAPTSSHIANIVFLQTDMKLIELCNRHNITYTRYVDDLTFSSSINFEEHVQEILDIVISDGFKISRRKTNLKPLQNVTGIDIFNNKIDASAKIKLKVEEERQSDDPAKPYTNYYNRILKADKKQSKALPKSQGLKSN